MNKLKVTKEDLLHIQGLAINAFLQLPTDSEFYGNNTDKLQAYSYVVGVLTWLKSKDILDLELEIEKGIK